MGKLCVRYLNSVIWQKPVAATVVLNDKVHVYRIQISAHQHLLERFSALLNPVEISRAGNYFQQKDRLRFIISRGAQRIILGRYLNMEPQALSFVLGENKKPGIDRNFSKHIHYNVSHSDDWIILAIAGATVGADIEHINPSFEFDDVLEEYFSAEEAAFIKKDASAGNFYLLWTRKESMLKATGQGLGAHLKLTPSLNGEHILDKSLNGWDNDWEISSFKVDEYYTASIAAPVSASKLSFLDPDIYY